MGVATSSLGGVVVVCVGSESIIIEGEEADERCCGRAVFQLTPREPN